MPDREVTATLTITEYVEPLHVSKTIHEVSREDRTPEQIAEFYKNESVSAFRIVKAIRGSVNVEEGKVHFIDDALETSPWYYIDGELISVRDAREKYPSDTPPHWLPLFTTSLGEANSIILRTRFGEWINPGQDSRVI